MSSLGKYDLGIDIGGTFIKYALVDKNYDIVLKWNVPTEKFKTKDQLYDYIYSNSRELEAVCNIGISAPGLIDADSNVKSYAAPNLRIMYGTNINHEISKRSGKKVATINDAKAAGLCELKMGNAKGTDSSAFLIIGTGTGGCICNREGVIYGKDNFAGEFHHLPFIDLRDNSIKRQGDYCSMIALLQIYNSKTWEKEYLKYGREIIKKYLKGHAIAQEAVEEWTDNITVQIITLAVFYNPEVICIGGGISEEEWFLDILREKFQNTMVEYFEETKPITTEIKRCKYNNDANILGAILNTKF